MEIKWHHLQDVIVTISFTWNFIFQTAVAHQVAGRMEKCLCWKNKMYINIKHNRKTIYTMYGKLFFLLFCLFGENKKRFS